MELKSNFKIKLLSFILFKLVILNEIAQQKSIKINNGHCESGQKYKKYKQAIHKTVYKHRKISSTSLASWKIQIETMTSYYFAIKMTKIDDKVLAKRQGAGCRGCRCPCQGGQIGVQPTLERFPLKPSNSPSLSQKCISQGKKSKIELTSK